MRRAKLYRFLRGRDGRNACSYDLRLRFGCGFCLVVESARDFLLVVQVLVTEIIRLIALVGCLRLLETGYCAVKIVLRGGKRSLGSLYLGLLR